MKKLLIILALLLVPIQTQAKVINMGQFKLTAYCPCDECSEGWDRQTHSGHLARSGYTVAADLSVMNIGDRITIDGKEYRVEDSGGGVRGDHLDIFFDTHEEVDAFGVKYGEVKIWR